MNASKVAQNVIVNASLQVIHHRGANDRRQEMVTYEDDPGCLACQLEADTSTPWNSACLSYIWYLPSSTMEDLIPQFNTSLVCEILVVTTKENSTFG
jgi:hypothetical protein